MPAADRVRWFQDQMLRGGGGANCPYLKTLAVGYDIFGEVPPARLEFMRGDFAEAVYEVAGMIPAGLVLSYGDIAELLEMAGPRQVGAAMSRSGDGSPWWRVIRAGGQPPRGLSGRALPFYTAEGTPLRITGSDGEPAADGYTINMREARWHPTVEERMILDGIRDRLAACCDPAAERTGSSDTAATGKAAPKMSVAHDGVLP